MRSPPQQNTLPIMFGHFDYSREWDRSRITGKPELRIGSVGVIGDFSPIETIPNRWLDYFPVADHRLAISIGPTHRS
jgi:hypothetical protein